MSIFFSADDIVMALVRKVMNDNHPDLVKTKVEVGVTFALSSKDDQPALKEHGQSSFGMTKIVAPKDRVRKNIDVELWIDGDEWSNDSPEHRYAKVDHLLTRIEIKKPKPKKKKKPNTDRQDNDDEQDTEEPLVDAGGKAVLKIRKTDLFVSSGYRQVIERNGAYAPECLILNRAKVVADAAIKTFEEEEVGTTEKAEEKVETTEEVAITA